MTECEFCCCEPATYYRVPTSIGTLADLCNRCAARYGPWRVPKQREPPVVGGPLVELPPVSFRGVDHGQLTQILQR
jgi:hypothetical protein